MTTTLSPTGEIINGDVFEILKTLPDESVNCCVTSPPYWGLRDYGVDGQLGLEKTPEEYVARMVEIFREVRRVLTKDGTLWLNLGDSYVSGKSRYSSKPQTLSGKSHDEPDNGKKPDLYYHPYLKDKDLCGIPWRVAFALQADGWYLRSDIIWHKPNPMPESVTDRPTKAHEYMFMMSKSAKYYYDAAAIMEEAAYDGRQDTIMKGSDKYANGFSPVQSLQTVAVKGHERWPNMKDGKQYRNKRSVWTVATHPYSGAHFATFPPKLIEPCILAGCPAGGVVLDPFMGSGTVALEAIRQDKRYLGIELNPAYVAMANNRIKDATRQMRFL